MTNDFELFVSSYAARLTLVLSILALKATLHENSYLAILLHTGVSICMITWISQTLIQRSGWIVMPSLMLLSAFIMLGTIGSVLVDGASLLQGSIVGLLFILVLFGVCAFSTTLSLFLLIGSWNALYLERGTKIFSLFVGALLLVLTLISLESKNSISFERVAVVGGVLLLVIEIAKFTLSIFQETAPD